MEIRPLAEADLPAFAGHFREGNPAQLGRALRLQSEDAAVMLVASQDGVPLGRVLLHWRPVPESPPEWHTAVSFPEEFLVLTPYRSQGIGTAIMAEVERLSRERGYIRVSVGVGLDNTRAHDLYLRLGYVDTNFGPFEDGGTFYDHAGKLIEWRETWTFVTKELA